MLKLIINGIALFIIDLFALQVSFAIFSASDGSANTLLPTAMSGIVSVLGYITFSMILNQIINSSTLDSGFFIAIVISIFSTAALIYFLNSDYLEATNKYLSDPLKLSVYPITLLQSFIINLIATSLPSLIWHNSKFSI